MRDLIEAVDKIIKNVDGSKKAINYAKKVLAKLESTIKLAKEEITQLGSVKESQIALDIARNEALNLAPKIMSGNIESAVARNDEYAYYAFLNPLFEVANTPELYEFIISGSGWSRKLKVRLAMDEVAGPIGDYAHAVESTRDSLGIKDDRDPEKASQLWRKIYNNRGGFSVYGKTISMRIRESGSTAPFWSLLNYGNKSISMSSDIGGKSYPSYSGTRFVEHTEEDIEKVFNSTFSRLSRENKANIKYLKESLKILQRAKAKLEAALEELENFDLVEFVIRHINRESEEIDRSKLINTINKIISGDRLSLRPNIGPRGTRTRVSIGILESAIRLAGIDY